MFHLRQAAVVASIEAKSSQELVPRAIVQSLRQALEGEAAELAEEFVGEHLGPGVKEWEVSHVQDADLSHDSTAVAGEVEGELHPVLEPGVVWLEDRVGFQIACNASEPINSSAGITEDVQI